MQYRCSAPPFELSGQPRAVQENTWTIPAVSSVFKQSIGAQITIVTEITDSRWQPRSQGSFPSLGQERGPTKEVLLVSEQR